MLIECWDGKKKETSFKCKNRQYLFATRAEYEGKQVLDVNEADITRLLRFPATFRIYNSPETVAPEVVEEPNELSENTEAQETERTHEEWMHMPLNMLRKTAKERKITVPPKAKKADIAALLEEQEKRV